MSEAAVVQLPSAIFFNDRGALVVPRVAEVIRDAGHVQVGTDGRLWRYHHGVYRADGDVWVRGRVREVLGERCQRKHFDEVLAWLRSFEPTVTAQAPTAMLNVRNGLLDWRSGELHPHDPDVVSTVQLPVAWNPVARCPRIERFFAEVLPSDAIDLAAEVMGYSVYAGNPFRKAVLALGPGGNGKSVFLALITRLAGPHNVASVPVQVFGENRFAAAELYGKLANVCGDLDARAIKRTDTFKMMTGGDPIMAERKNCHPFSFVSFALPLFSANEAPISSDQTQAWFDRWLIIPMERRIEGTPMADPHLTTRLSTPGEMQGALVLAVEGLRRLMARGGFASPGSVTAASEQYRDRLDTVRGFVAEECVMVADAWAPRSALYKAYRMWCSDSGRMPVSATTFNDHLRANYATLEERGRKGIRGWSGIGLIGGPSDAG